MSVRRRARQASERYVPRALLVRTSYLLIPIMLLANWIAFDANGVSYARWYLENGSLISIIVAFFALAWEGLRLRYDLVAANPARYLIGCLRMQAVIATGMAAMLDVEGEKRANLNREIRRIRNQLAVMKSSSTGERVTRIGGEPPAGSHQRASVLDGIAMLLAAILMLAAACGWFVVVAPLNWALTLLTGAPVRLTQRGTLPRAYVIEREGHTTVGIVDAHRSLPAAASDISLTRDPFAFSQALNAAVIFVLNTALNWLVW